MLIFSLVCIFRIPTIIICDSDGEYDADVTVDDHPSNNASYDNRGFTGDEPDDRIRYQEKYHQGKRNSRYKTMFDDNGSVKDMTVSETHKSKYYDKNSGRNTEHMHNKDASSVHSYKHETEKYEPIETHTRRENDKYVKSRGERYYTNNNGYKRHHRSSSYETEQRYYYGDMNRESHVHSHKNMGYTDEDTGSRTSSKSSARENKVDESHIHHDVDEQRYRSYHSDDPSGDIISLSNSRTGKKDVRHKYHDAEHPRQYSGSGERSDRTRHTNSDITNVSMNGDSSKRRAPKTLSDQLIEANNYRSSKLSSKLSQDDKVSRRSISSESTSVSTISTNSTSQSGSSEEFLTSSQEVIRDRQALYRHAQKQQHGKQYSSARPAMQKPLAKNKVSTKEVKSYDTPERVQANNPERVRANTPEKVQANTPVSVQANTPERVRANTPEKVQINTPERVRANTPERVKTNTAERVRANLPERVRVLSFDDRTVKGRAATGPYPREKLFAPIRNSHNPDIEEMRRREKLITEKRTRRVLSNSHNNNIDSPNNNAIQNSFSTRSGTDSVQVDTDSDTLMDIPYEMSVLDTYSVFLSSNNYFPSEHSEFAI